MPRVLEMCDDLAERFAFDPAKVVGYSRQLREAGLLSTGARGRHAPKADAVDVARLLIPMMLRSKIADASETAKFFGEQIATKDGRTFEFYIAATLDFCGAPYDDSAESEQHFKGHAVTLSIMRDFGIGRMKIYTGDEQHEMLFRPATEIDGLTPEAVEERYRKYRSGFREEPALLMEDMIALGQVLAGHRPLGWTFEAAEWDASE